LLRQVKVERKISFSAILESDDLNLFVVDWSKGAKTLNYTEARFRVNDVAKVVANFIELVHDYAGLNYENITMVGFSLGAHISGIAGKFLDGFVKKIVGLDPAGPLFEYNDPDNRLSRDSATYTECLHTTRYYGFQRPICHVDVYFNSGSKQPGCLNKSGEDFEPCSHSRVLEYFIEALNNPRAFYGYRCQSSEKAFERKCFDEPGLFINDDNNDEKYRVMGIYHVTTNAHSPFGRGEEIESGSCRIHLNILLCFLSLIIVVYGF
jgi:pancreatic triacylglycerol lipase